MKLFSIAKIKIPHVFVLLTAVILFCSILTHIIPAGMYQREKKTYGELTRTTLIPGTYEELDKHVSIQGLVLGDHADHKASPVSLLEFLTAIPRGMSDVSDIIFLIFIIGGVLGILQKTGTIIAVIQALLHRFSNSASLLTLVLMLVLAIGGSTFGLGEELIPLVPIFLIVSQKLGYDRIYGLSLVYLAAAVGFAAATTNPFTVQIAQGIAEIQPGSGILFRLVFFVAALLISLIYVLRYGRKIKQDPSKSIDYDESISENQFEKVKLKASHVWIIVSTGLIFALIVYAIQAKGWWLAEMSGGFILMGIIAILISGISLSDAVNSFIKGMEEMVVAALVVGFAKGVQIVLQDGQILDSIIYYAATLLSDSSKLFAAQGMLVFQTILNFFIPSGSGQAAVTMPIMAPLADVLGISRQVSVFAFTCGDGFANLIIPTSGVLMAMLSIAKIPYQKWLRFIFPLFLQLILLSGLFLAIAIMIGY